MPKKKRLNQSNRADVPSAAEDDAPPEVRAKSPVRAWFLVAAATAAIAGGAWWVTRAMKNAEITAALAELQPVASSVPPDQRERREALEIADRLLQEYPDSPEAIFGAAPSCSATVSTKTR